MTTVAGRSAGHADRRGEDPGRGDGRFSPRTRRWAGFGAFAVLAYLPILLTHPGRVDADTKTYLYLDPGRLLTQALSMWDPSIGLGTVSHQTIGYLFPMGPFYWVLEQGIGVPSWVAQRLWLGSLIFGAGMAMWFLLRTIGVRGPGVAVGVLAYAFSPYVLQYSARFSVILGPWAALPLLIALVALALRRGGWRYAAIFALVIQLIGGVNATALLFAGLGPVLWIAYSVWVRRDATLGRAWQVCWRTGLLTLVTSLWWMAGLWAQGSFGLDILQYTETVETVSITSYANEIWRGLGYWFFYFGEIVRSRDDAAVQLTARPLLILTSFAVPALALASAAIVRWRDRVFFVALIVVGMVIAVGASPYDNPAPVGSVFKAFANSSSAGLAMRSTSRAVPLLVLGVAALLAAGVSALHDVLGRHHRVLRAVVVIGVGALVLINAPGVWGGYYYNHAIERDEEVPQYWQAALDDVDSRPHDTRVFGLPGSDFAAYRWGTTIDPIEPGLMDRPYVARELVPWGSPASAAFLEAIDRRVQTGELAPDAIAPLARLLAAGDVLLRMDLQTGRYNLVRSEELWRMFTEPPPAGLEAPRVYGDEIPGKPLTRVDEETIAAGDDGPEPPPVAIFGVEDAQRILRATSIEGPVIVAGDADGLVDAAGAAVLDPDRVVLFSGSYASEPAKLREQIDRDATLVLTDTNRRRSHRWTGAHDNSGHTEQVGESALREDARDARLEVLPDATDAAFTVADQRGVHEVTATSYGFDGLTPQPGFRAVRALDGDPLTAWEVGGTRQNLPGERIRVVLDEPITTDQVNLLQPIQGPRGRWIEQATLTFDGRDPVHVDLGPSSRDESGEGQTLHFPQRTFRTFELRIDRVHERPPTKWKISPKPGDSVRSNASYVGIAEIRLRDEAPGAETISVDEYFVMPSDLLDVAGTASLDHPLVLTMTRDGRAGDPRVDAEYGLRRAFSLP
ncbi:MAG TPA: alpha-(1-_3)-arabinofuranosyltransferase family protein, partial [Acidimicrobiia bacterium]|nr:alpha-(1->3)-arabinofuranosyltransferase family protein [Acidimicrobiia bacterium]